MAKQELVATIRDRYRRSSKKDKGRILDEFTAITGPTVSTASGCWVALPPIKASRPWEGAYTTRPYPKR